VSYKSVSGQTQPNRQYKFIDQEKEQYTKQGSCDDLDNWYLCNQINTEYRRLFTIKSDFPYIKLLYDEVWTIEDHFLFRWNPILKKVQVMPMINGADGAIWYGDTLFFNRFYSGDYEEEEKELVEEILGKTSYETFIQALETNYGRQHTEMEDYEENTIRDKAQIGPLMNQELYATRIITT